MSDLAINGATWMTVKEMSDATGIPERTIHNAIDRVLPGVKKNGLTTMLTEHQVSIVSAELKKAHNSDLASTGKVVTTDLEMAQKTVEVISFYMAKLEAATTELAITRPKAEAADALLASTRTMSITDAAKHFGLHPKAEVFPYLRARGYLTSKDLPTQDAIDAGYLALREAKCQDGEFRKQAVVMASQLDTWRQRVVPQVRAWMEVEA